MASKLERPRFVSLLLGEAKRRYDSRGILAILPLWIGAIILLFSLVNMIVPETFWKDSSKNIPFYIGVLTLDGLLLTLAWNAFAKIFENVCTPQFMQYLKDNGMIEIYIFHITYVHAAQLIALVTCAAALLVLLCDHIPDEMQRIMFILTLSSAAYAVKEVVGVVTTLYDLVWYRSIFEAEKEKAGNVTALPNMNRGK